MQTRILLLMILALASWRAEALHAQDKAAAAKAQAAAREEQLNAQAQQYVQMMQPSLWRELDFVRLMCELPPEQRPKIKAAGEAAVKQAAREMIQPQRGRARNVYSARQTIRNAIAEALQQALPADQVAHYKAEALQLTEAEKQAAIASAVAQVDAALFFNNQQRDKLVQALDKNWQENWAQWLMMWQYGGQYYPQIPDQHVTPLLTDEQKVVWRGLQRVDISSWGGEPNRQADDDWWEGKPATDKGDGKGKAKAKAKAKLYEDDATP